MKLAKGAVLRAVMSLACRSAIFLAEGPKIHPEPNFSCFDGMSYGDQW